MTAGEKMKPNRTGPTRFHQEEHYEFRTCAAANCEPVSRKKIDLGEGWAYCDHCAFEVAAEGQTLLPHSRSIGLSASGVSRCGGTTASTQPGPEAKPKSLWFTLEEEDEDDDDDTDASGGD